MNAPGCFKGSWLYLYVIVSPAHQNVWSIKKAITMMAFVSRVFLYRTAASGGRNAATVPGS